VEIHDLLHDHQTEAGAGRLRGEERQKDLLARLRGNPLTVVRDLDDGVTLAGIERHLDPGVRQMLRGLQGVTDHVGEGAP
jgi:hypothetical protein